jgi:transposase
MILHAVSYGEVVANQAVAIVLSGEEREFLENTARSSTAPHGAVLRSKIILDAAGGESNEQIAQRRGTRRATVSQWRLRFAERRLDGLKDESRPGAKKIYDTDTERRILAVLDQSPPKGFGVWSGKLIAEALGDVSEHHVWRVLRKNKVYLRATKSWCESQDPEFAAKAADIVGLYVNPPEGALVISFDEKPTIQALERAQGYLRFPDGKTLTGRSHDYKRHGTTHLFAALNVASGQISTGHYNRKRRREFLDFMNRIVKKTPDSEIHVVLDNLSTHKPKHDQWLARHKNVHFHYTPTHSSWLNQIEIWFGILEKRSLYGASFTSPKQVREHIDAFVAAYNNAAKPFEWTKTAVGPKRLKGAYGK